MEIHGDIVIGTDGQAQVKCAVCGHRLVTDMLRGSELSRALEVRRQGIFLLIASAVIAGAAVKMLANDRRLAEVPDRHQDQDEG